MQVPSRLRIRSFTKGERLTAEWTRNVADALNQNVNSADSTQDEVAYGYIDSAELSYGIYEFDVSAANVLHRNNVLSLKLKIPEESSRTLLTTHSRQTEVDVPVPVYALLPGESYLLRASPTHPPTKGAACGVFGAHTLDSRGSGFVALTNPFVVGSGSLLWARFNGAGGGSALRLFKIPAAGLGPAVTSISCVEYPDGPSGSPGSTSQVTNLLHGPVHPNAFVLTMEFDGENVIVDRPMVRGGLATNPTAMAAMAGGGATTATTCHPLGYSGTAWVPNITKTISLHNTTFVPIPADSIIQYKMCEWTGLLIVDTWSCFGVSE